MSPSRRIVSSPENLHSERIQRKWRRLRTSFLALRGLGSLGSLSGRGPSRPDPCRLAFSASDSGPEKFHSEAGHRCRFSRQLGKCCLKKIPTLVKGKTWRKCCTSRLAFRGESRDARFSPDFGAATPSPPLPLHVHDPGIRWEG